MQGCGQVMSRELWAHLLSMWWQFRHFYLHTLPHQWEQPLELRRQKVIGFSLSNTCTDFQTIRSNISILFLQASQVLILREGMLASPDPCSLVAMILNWYSIQGYKSVTSALSTLPSRKAGAEGDTSVKLFCAEKNVSHHLIDNVQIFLASWSEQIT